MTLHIIHSNKVENLHDELCYLLKSKPLENPFDIETIVCPSQAMARWINNRFTLKMGIAAHYDYPLPASWVWQLAAQCLPQIPEQDPLQRDILAWRIFYALKPMLHHPAFASIKQYLKHDDNATKRWALAKKTAFVFERYQHFRPQLIQSWKQGADDDWQALLWQKITANDVMNRVQLLTSLGSFLSRNTVSETLPKRVSFFSVSALPPLLFQTIQALAKHCDVYFFVLSPSPHYWSDFISLKQQAKLRLKSPGLNDYYTTGHELLASWGRQGQIFQDMLLSEMDDALTQHYDVYDTNEHKTLLGVLQQSLFDLSDTHQSLALDDSIRINQCHSPLRECEVIHDQCLALLEKPEINPEDILVIVPNMDEYAVSIEAVFKKSDDQASVKPFIPWNLSDSSLQADNPLTDIFLNVLTLVHSRFTATDMLSYLECPALLQQFNIEQGDKAIIRDYIQQAHINWGIDSAHKNEFNLPGTEQNTWSYAQQRFFCGYAISETRQQNGILPLTGFSSTRAHVIARFLYLIDTLNTYRKKLDYDRSAIDWQYELNTLLSVLFGHHDDNGCQLIRDAIDDWAIQAQADSTEQDNLSITLVHNYFNDYFNQTRSAQHFFSGGVTFCGMRPMRSVPFKVIIMLGMNEHEFPRHNHGLEFDLMAQQWQPGDLLISDEDRYLFLEAILCARHTLIMSYCAYNLKDNTIKNPSHLVSELSDYLASHISLTDSKPDIIQAITYSFPMHVFSADNYSNTYQSYNQYWAKVAQQLQHKDTAQTRQIHPKATTIQELEKIIPLSQLIQCLKDPIKFYFKTQLKITLYDEQDIRDDEPFSLNALEQWQLKNQLLQTQLEQKTPVLEEIMAQAVLPHGMQAKACFKHINDELNEQLTGLDDYLQQPAQTVAVTINLGQHSLTGEIPHYYPELGLLCITPSKWSGKPFIEAWLMHCAISTQHNLTRQPKCLLYFKDKKLCFKPLKPAQAHDYLQQALTIMQRALQAPLTVFPKCSFIYHHHLLLNDEETALKKCLLAWHGNPQNKASLGEKENDLVQLAFQDKVQDPDALFHSDTFKKEAAIMYDTALKHCQFEDIQ